MILHEKQYNNQIVHHMKNKRGDQRTPLLIYVSQNNPDKKNINKKKKITVKQRKNKTTGNNSDTRGIARA